MICTAPWHRLGLHDASQFDLVFRLARGTGVMTKDEALQGLQHPPLAAWISAREDALKQFLDWALEDRQFASLGFGRVLQALRQKASTIAKLGENVRRQGLDAIRNGETVKAANALEIILPMTTAVESSSRLGRSDQRVQRPRQTQLGDPLFPATATDPLQAASRRQRNCPRIDSVDHRPK